MHAVAWARQLRLAGLVHVGYAALWLPAELCLPPGDASNSPGASHFFFAELYDQMLFERYVVVMADCGVLHPQTCKGRMDQNSCVCCC